MSRYKITLIIILSILIWGSILVFGYYASQWPKQEFKKSTKRMSKLLARLDRRIDEGIQKRQALNKTRHPWKKYIQAVSNVNKYQKDWTRISDGYEKILRRAPHNKYADDAAFCLALEYTILSSTLDRGSTDNPYRQKALDATEYFHQHYPSPKIDKYNREKLKDVFWKSFDTSEKSIFSIQTPLGTRLYGVLLMEQVEGLKEANQVDKAREIYTKLETEFPNDKIAGYAKEQLNEMNY